jgi:hypothetical protein
VEEAADGAAGVLGALHGGVRGTAKHLIVLIPDILDELVFMGAVTLVSRDPTPHPPPPPLPHPMNTTLGSLGSGVAEVLLIFGRGGVLGGVRRGGVLRGGVLEPKY